MQNSGTTEKRGPQLRVLVVDDDADAREILASILQARGWRTELAEDGVVALQKVEEFAPDVVIADLEMPRMNGLALLRALREIHRALPVIVATAHSELDVGIAAMRDGAADYLTKPINVNALTVAIERVVETRNIRLEAEHLRKQLREQRSEGLENLLGTSAPMERVYHVAMQVAPTRATVLITGESGTGKSELAKAIHAKSTRASGPYVSLHCASLAESILESELFGHEKGAFTGADRRRIGRFEQANGGTLFLDEIGEIPPSTQVKLLQVLQEMAFERVGGNEPIRVDVRLLAATNRDLAADVRDGRFREDLYYRLNVVQIEMPPLRLRGNDILTLADHFVWKFAKENKKAVQGLTDRARSRILASKWPGNVRALENAIERATVLAEGPLIDVDDLCLEPGPESLGPLRIPGSSMQEIERFAILRTMDAVGNSTSRAAEILGIGVRTIQYRLHEYGRARPRSGVYESIPASPSSRHGSDSLLDDRRLDNEQTTGERAT